MAQVPELQRIFNQRTSTIYRFMVERVANRRSGSRFQHSVSHFVPFTETEFTAWILECLGGRIDSVVQCAYCNAWLSVASFVVDHLRPFAPGQSGNPGGRPKKAPITDYLRAQLAAEVPPTLLERLKPADRAVVADVLGTSPTFGQLVAFRAIQQAIKGDVYALREILDRVEGKVTQKIAGEDGGPIHFIVTRAGGGWANVER